MSYDPHASKLARTFSLDKLLKQRGLSFKTQQTLDNTLFPKIKQKVSTLNEKEFLDLIANQETRKQIRADIYSGSNQFIYKGQKFNFSKNDESAFTDSFEWYVSKILEDDFDFFTSGYGIKLEGTHKGADFDVLGFGLDLFVHVECKSGHPDNITQEKLGEFKARCDAIGADINIFYIDYNGINFDEHKILRHFTKAFYENGNLYKITKGDSAFEIYQVDIAPIFIIDTHQSRKDPINNFKEIFYLYFKVRAHEKINSGYSPEIFQGDGYKVEKCQKSEEHSA